MSDCSAGPGLSVAFRHNLLDYDLSPNELRLAELLCLETFDASQTRGRIEMDRWAERLGFRDSKGLRPDKCAVILTTLKDLGVIDLNPAQATFEPRPDANLWSRARAYRARAISEPAAAELALRDERELPEMLSELNRQAAIGQGSSAKSADVVGEIRRPSAKSADAPVQRLTFNRSNVLTNKRSTLGPSEKSADVDCEQVRQAVRSFVGENDYQQHWARAGYVWENPDRVQCLAGSLAFLQAGVQSGEVLVKTTRGAVLWSQAQIDWRKQQRAVT